MEAGNEDEDREDTDDDHRDVDMDGALVIAIHLVDDTYTVFTFLSAQLVLVFGIPAH